MFCSNFRFHKWTKWEEYVTTVPVKINMELVYLSMLDKNIQPVKERQEIWQHRTCEICGKHERERV